MHTAAIWILESCRLGSVIVLGLGVRGVMERVANLPTHAGLWGTNIGMAIDTGLAFIVVGLVCFCLSDWALNAERRKCHGN